MAATRIVVYGTPTNETMRKAAVPMMGGVMEPPEEAVASTAPATRGVKPERIMAGIVIGPVVSTLDTAEPDIMPMVAEDATATFAEPPR